jgi:predicted  nucleic acid-binding Zn-ribbon protein
MTWMLLAVTIGAVVYAITVFSEYKGFLEGIQPQIKRLQEGADSLEKTLDAEVSQLKESREQLESAKQVVEELKDTVRLAEKQLRTATQREEELELQLYKAEFQASKKAR